MAKICVICTEDCSNEPRFKNEDGHYLHQSCHLIQQAANKKKKPVKPAKKHYWFIRPNQPRTWLQPRTWQNRLIGFLLMLSSVYVIAKLYPNLSELNQYLDEHKPRNWDEDEPQLITMAAGVFPLLLGLYSCCCLSKRFTKRFYRLAHTKITPYVEAP